MANQIDMTEGSIFNKLVKFSIPLVFSSFLQVLFNAVDVIVVGRFAGDNSLAAVGSTGSLVNLLVNLFMGLSIGTNVVAAHYFGAKKSKELKDTVHTAMLVSVYSGIALTIIGVFGAEYILKLMQAPKEVLDLAAVYLKIYFLGITATMVYNFGSALLRAKGDTKRPLYILSLAGILNLILNLIFVIVFKMNVAGVAIATVISQVLSAILVVRILLKEEDSFRLNLKQLKINSHILLKIVKIGIPAGCQGIMFSFSNVIIQSSINTFGAIAIAGNSAALNLEGFIYTAMNGFSQGALTFCSQNMGAKEYKRIKKAAFESQIIVFIIGVILSFLFYIFLDLLLGFYTTSPEVVLAGRKRLIIILSTYYLCGMMDTMANCIRGIGHSLAPVIITLIGACLFRMFWIFTIFQIPKFHTETVIYLSYPISWAVTFLALLFTFVKFYKKIGKQEI